MSDRQARIVVIDDEAANVELLRLALRRAQVGIVEGFTDPARGLAAVQSSEPDLVLLDLRMPGLDGFGVLEAIRSTQRPEAYLPVVVLTADTEAGPRRRALDAGATDFLTKPLDLAEVVLRCRNLLRTRELHLALHERNAGLRTELGEQLAAFEQAQRERQAIASALARLEVLGTPEETASRICAELVRVAGVDGASLVRFGSARAAGAVIVAGTDLEPSQMHAIASGRAERLRQRAASGPWVEERGDPSQQDQSRDGRSRICAPLNADGEVFGVLVAWTRERVQGRDLVQLLPAVVEFAAVASALIGPELTSGARRSELRAEIERIIANHALRTVFQPVFSLNPTAVVGYEALTRFLDGERPDRRLALAAAVDLGTELELACLTQALRAAHALPAQPWLSLNASPALLTATDLAPALAGHRGGIVLEVTEHVAVDDYPGLRIALARLGPDVKLAIDDAGAGFASFRHILELHPDFVKLDIALVRGIDRDPAREALVAGMVHFAERTGCTLIAEGIETHDELERLVHLGVPLGQGYLLGRPTASPAPAAADRVVEQRGANRPWGPRGDQGATATNVRVQGRSG